MSCMHNVSSEIQKGGSLKVKGSKMISWKACRYNRDTSDRTELK